MTRPTGNPRGRKPKYLFADLAVGDSFLVAIPHMGRRTSVASAASHHGRRYGKTLSTHVVMHQGQVKVRVTRIA